MPTWPLCCFLSPDTPPGQQLPADLALGGRGRMRSQDHTDWVLSHFLLFPACTASCHLSCRGLVQNTLEGLLFFFFLTPSHPRDISSMAGPAYPTSPCSAIKEEIPLHKLLRFPEIPGNPRVPSVHTSCLSSLLRDLHLSSHAPSLSFIQTSNLAYPGPSFLTWHQDAPERLNLHALQGIL